MLMVRLAVGLLLSLLLVTGVQAKQRRTIKQLLNEGKRLYREAQFMEALEQFDKVAARPNLKSGVQVELHQYRAFCFFVLGGHAQAEQEWQKLLTMKPGFELDPDEVSPEFVKFFGAIGATVEPPEPEPAAPVETSPPDPDPWESEPTEEIVARPVDETATIDEQTALDAPKTERGCGLWLCAVPFGVGQFANDRPIKGAIFAALEVGFLAANLGLYWNRVATYDREGAVVADQNLLAQRVFFGLFLGTVAVGIVDAYLFP